MVPQLVKAVCTQHFTGGVASLGDLKCQKGQ